MDRLGRYQILDPIGSGPCGAVVRAKVYGVVGVDRQFALKQILPALTGNAAYAQALSVAARAYSSLEHPRIARLAEFTVSQGKTFTATELVTGLDVGRVVAEGRVSGAALPPGGALTLLSAAARAVGFAHGRGLLHLGLCPQNLLISADGDIKVTDFGILAACLPERPVQEPRLAHRVAYLAPEQLVGEPTSAATDVFALGAIAIEMVTGTPAFRGETPLDVQHAVLSGQLSDPSLPRPIVKVLQRCLARAPFERFPDARALADALDAALRAAPVPGSRQDISERVKAIMAHLAALNEGGLSGVVSLPSSMPQPPLSPTRPPTVLSDEVISTPTSLPEHDRLETAEFLREDSYDVESSIDEELDDDDDRSPHTVVQPIADSPSRSHRSTDAPMIAATLRGISAVSPPRPMPPSNLGQPLSSMMAPPPLPPSAGRPGAVKPTAGTDAPLAGGREANSGAIVGAIGAAAAPDASGRVQGPAAASQSQAVKSTPASRTAALARPSGAVPPSASGPASGAVAMPARADTTATATAVSATAPARPSTTAIGSAAAPPSAPSLPSIIGGRPPSAVGRPGTQGGQGGEEVTRELRVARPVNAARGDGTEADQAAPNAPQDSGGEVTAARQLARGNAWEEAMESFEQPTRLNESLTAALVPSTNRTGQSPLLQLDELVMSSLSDPLPRASSPSAAAVAGPGGDRPSARSIGSGSGSAAALPGGMQAPTGRPPSSSPYPSATGLIEAALAEAEPVVPDELQEGHAAAAASSANAGAHGAGAAGAREGAAAHDGPSAPDAPDAPVMPDAPIAGEQAAAAGAAPSARGSNNDLFRSSALVQVIESDSPDDASSRRALDPFGAQAGQGGPPQRPSERSMRHGYSSGYGGDQASPQLGDRAGSQPNPHGDPYGRGGAGFGRPVLPPLPMSFAPEQEVPRLTGAAGRWLWMLLGMVIVLGSAAAAYAVFGGFSDRGTLASPDPQLAATSPATGDAGLSGDAAGDGGATTEPATAAVDGGIGDGKPSSDGATATATSTNATNATTPSSLPGTNQPAPGVSGDKPPEAVDGITITSTPSGARVFIDGADQGPTPLRLPGPPDRHTAVLFLAGHDLATLEIDKNGNYAAQLKEITPLGGPGGIKVRCRFKDRYYVYVDGKPTGALCPTERLEVDRGEHQIEIYDLISETRRQFRMTVKDISRSTRIRVD